MPGRRPQPTNGRLYVAGYLYAWSAAQPTNGRLYATGYPYAWSVAQPTNGRLYAAYAGNRSRWKK
jgi:hypothetical protein